LLKKQINNTTIASYNAQYIDGNNIKKKI
jgi:hypothetical protein